MQCPRCGSTNVVVLQQEHRKGYGVCSGLLGYICFGWIGLICGMCGVGKTTGYSAQIACGNCGTRSRI